MSNILDSEVAKDISRGKPVKRPQRKSVTVSLVGSELPTKVGEGEEGMLVVKTLLVFAVAAFHLSVMPGRIRPDQLVPDA